MGKYDMPPERLAEKAYTCEVYNPDHPNTAAYLAQ